MRCAKQAKKNPREIAQIIVDHLPENDLIESVEIAGPGFINIRLTPASYQSVLFDVLVQKENYGKGEIPEGMRYVNLEYVSANPTGPMHVGHGRWAALGDATARVMRHAGYDVYEEFYINDAGVQMDLFGKSVACRYLQLLGQDIPMIENGYGGGYIKDIAQGIIDRDGDKWVDVDEETRTVEFREIAYAEMLQLMKDTLAGFRQQVRLLVLRSAASTSTVPDGTSPVSRSIKAMDEKGYIYVKDGATWFKSSAFDDEKDRVLIKANGEMTYFMSDVAYHYNKMERGFDHLVNIWGADHHGHVARLQAALDGLGLDGSHRLVVVLMQLVNLMQDGKPVRMSKRSGKTIALHDLLDEISVDAARYFFNSRASTSPLDFDLDLAVREDSENPVLTMSSTPTPDLLPHCPSG